MSVIILILSSPCHIKGMENSKLLAPTKFLALKNCAKKKKCLKCSKLSLKAQRTKLLLVSSSHFLKFSPCLDHFLAWCSTLYGAQPFTFRAFLFTSFFEFSPCLAHVLSARHCTFRTIPFQFVGFLFSLFHPLFVQDGRLDKKKDWLLQIPLSLNCIRVFLLTNAKYW